jgi:hypothetical protein
MTKWVRPRNCFHYFEAVGSWLFSLFCTVFTILKHLEADCFHYFALFSLFGSIWKLTVFDVLHCFDSENTKQRKQWASRFFQNSENSELPDSSNTVKTVSFKILPKQRKQWASRFFQNSENSELPDSSKTVKKVSWSQFFDILYVLYLCL